MQKNNMGKLVVECHFWMGRCSFVYQFQQVHQQSADNMHVMAVKHCKFCAYFCENSFESLIISSKDLFHFRCGWEKYADLHTLFILFAQLFGIWPNSRFPLNLVSVWEFGKATTTIFEFLFGYLHIIYSCEIIGVSSSHT